MHSNSHYFRFDSLTFICVVNNLLLGHLTSVIVKDDPLSCLIVRSQDGNLIGIISDDVLRGFVYKELFFIVPSLLRKQSNKFEALPYK